MKNEKRQQMVVATCKMTVVAMLAPIISVSQHLNHHVKIDNKMSWRCAENMQANRQTFGSKDEDFRCPNSRFVEHRDQTI
jgi:hypothetical protein